ncbi:MAG: GNAT family N-acetyltransferase, partial [Candidatus Kapaibacterium sp.]
GFAYQRHYISHAIELRGGIQPFERFQPTARKHIRRVFREHPEVLIEEVVSAAMTEGLKEFYPILLENKAKFGAKPTHSLEELVRLNLLLPDLMKLFLVRVNGDPIAGSLLFLANSRVLIIFYHMLKYSFDEYKPIYLLMDKVTHWAQEHNYSFVDIGVSQDTHDENPMTPALSLIRFKEKFDSRGVLRSTMGKSYKP